jgi:uncharacterized OsmC-like protein/alpha/beta superfamily hydrolase
MTIRSDKVTFEGTQGRLRARLDRPDDAPLGWAIFAHCFTCSKDSSASSRISRSLAERGFGVLRFDFTGLGDSEGEFANTNFSSNVEDLVHAAQFLANEHGTPELLVGHSLGGAAVLAASARISGVRAVATINAPFDPAHVAHLIIGKQSQIAEGGVAEVEIGDRTFRITKQFLDDLAEQKSSGRLASLRAALLVIHAPRDTVVGIDNARLIFDAAKHPKSFISLDDADHLLTRREDATYVADVLSAWASRYLSIPLAETRADRPSPLAGEGHVVVVETGESQFSQTIAAGHHTLRSDEPAAMGGGDTGPTPYDLLLASLGACTSMTLRMYASHKNLPLERVAVRLRHDKRHAADCADCETRVGKIDFIEREIELEGELSDAQRTRLLEIADRCPVHRTLQSEIKISSRLV